MHDSSATALLAEFLAGIRLTHVLAPMFRKLSGPELARELRRIWRRFRETGMESGLAEVLSCGLYRALAARERLGEAAAVEAELLIVKWVARGLARSVLENIRTGVFNIVPPSSP